MDPSNPSPLSDSAPDSFPPEESTDGVDLTLIRWTLSLTPLERLELLQDWVDGITELRQGQVTITPAADIPDPESARSGSA